MTNLKTRLVVLFASLCYIGHLPASGTWASLATIPPFLLLSRLGSEQISGSQYYVIALVVLTIFGTWISHLGEKVFKEHDSHKIVIDESVGFLFAMLWLPVTFWTVAGAFILFRLLDIVKPFPIGRSQQLPGGTGVMADDVLAGLCTMGILQIIRVVVLH